MAAKTLQVNPNALAGNGLSVENDKLSTGRKIIADPEHMGDASYIGDLKIYVDCNTGVDDLSEGRGLSQEKPFRSIQYALDYTHYHIDVQSFTSIHYMLADGDYTKENPHYLIVKRISSMGSTQVIQGNTTDSSKVIIPSVYISKTCNVVYVIFCTIKYTENSGWGTAWYALFGCYFNYCCTQAIIIDLSEAPETLSGAYLISQSNCSLLWQQTTVNPVTNYAVEIKVPKNGITIATVYTCATHGLIVAAGKVAITGGGVTVNNNCGFAYVYDSGAVKMSGTFTGTVHNRKYYLARGGQIYTMGGGATKLLGDTDGFKDDISSII